MKLEQGVPRVQLVGVGVGVGQILVERLSETVVPAFEEIGLDFPVVGFQSSQTRPSHLG
jgi:hypothetical protein